MTARFAMKVALNIFSCPLTESMKELPYKVILFDLFHTLVDVGRAPQSSGRYTADILGVGRDAWNRACFSSAHDIISHTNNVDVIRALAHSLDPAIPEGLIREAAEERLRRFEHALIYVEDEVLESLQGLCDAGLRLGLLSNASTGEVQGWAKSPLAPLFEQAFFSCECGLAKPDPAFFHHAMSVMGVSVAECLFVGDGGSNEHEGARAVGIDNVLLTRHLAHFDEERLAPRRAAVRWEISGIAGLRGILSHD